MLSVQSSPNTKWEDKEEKAFWRGRDSRRERLNLVSLSRQHPELINASLTNFFFFRDEEETYGPKEDHVSFFKFFDVSMLAYICWVASFHLKIFDSLLVQVPIEHRWYCCSLSFPLPPSGWCGGHQAAVGILWALLWGLEADGALYPCQGRPQRFGGSYQMG